MQISDEVLAKIIETVSYLYKDDPDFGELTANYVRTFLETHEHISEADYIHLTEVEQEIIDWYEVFKD